MSHEVNTTINTRGLITRSLNEFTWMDRQNRSIVETSCKHFVDSIDLADLHYWDFCYLIVLIILAVYTVFFNTYAYFFVRTGTGLPVNSTLVFYSFHFSYTFLLSVMIFTY